MEKFTKKLVEELEDFYGESVTIHRHDILKANDTKYHAIVVRRKGEDAGMTLCIEPLYEKYRRGVSVEDVVEEILGTIKEQPDMSHFNSEYVEQILKNYDFMKSNMIIKLLNKERNVEYLKGKLHFEILDMAATFYSVVCEKDEVMGLMAIPQVIYEGWGVSKGELFRDVLESMQEKNPPVFLSLTEVVDRMTGNSFSQYMNPPELPEDKQAYVLTNKTNNNGATSVLFPGQLMKMAEQLCVDELVLLPSSLHEMIVIPRIKGKESYYQEFRDMVAEVNQTCVEPMDFLSDNIYLYRKEDDAMKIIE